MIPPEITALMDLINPHWDELDDRDVHDLEQSAWRIWRAGFRKVEEPQ